MTSEQDAIVVIQRAVANSAIGDWAEVELAIGRVVDEALWKGRFGSFNEFCIDAPPAGLGVRTAAGAKLVRRALLNLGHLRIWAELLERIATKPGNPTLTIAQSDNLRFYCVATSYSSTDRILLTLKSKHPKLFEDVYTFAITPREAALELGWIKIPPRYHRQFLAVAAALNPADQVSLLRQVFDLVSDEAQSSFLAGLGVCAADRPS